VSLRALKLGLIPLVDAAPLIVARDMGFAAEEGLALDIVRAPSWSNLRDMVRLGRVEAAHMLAPVPVAGALGLGGSGAELHAASVLSVNGTVVCLSLPLAERVRAAGHDFAFDDARAAGTALIAALPALRAENGGDRRLRIGVPFPFSMHAELMWYWLSALGLPAPQGVWVRTIPPPQMARAMAAGEIDAFCVGEPWGSVAVEEGVAEMLLPGAAIWAFAPEKVLALRAEWAEAERESLQRLIRALWRAGRWLADPERRVVAVELLSRSGLVDAPSELLDRALSGRLVLSRRGEERQVPDFLEFHRGAATFPWRSQAAWIGGRMAGRLGLDRASSEARARAVFRSDLHRDALEGTGADLPGASSKVEGATRADTPVASREGRLFLRRDAFFDGRIFDLAVQR
jgi:NitT/TauT family transport system ATP-binding protein